MYSKKALITGVAGQDGSYLAEYLLSLGYEVHGMVRRNSTSENQSAATHVLLVMCLETEKVYEHHWKKRVLQGYSPLNRNVLVAFSIALFNETPSFFIDSMASNLSATT